MKDEARSHLKKTQWVSVATCEHGQPRVRPMTLIYNNEKFYFATGAEDEKCRQIDANPKGEFCNLFKAEDYYGYLRVAGRFQDITDVSVKKEIADISGFVYEYWKDAADPGYKLYEFIVTEVSYLKPGETYANPVVW